MICSKQIGEKHVFLSCLLKNHCKSNIKYYFVILVRL